MVVGEIIHELSKAFADNTTLKYSAPEWNYIRPDGTFMSAGEFASVRGLTENRVVENIETSRVKADGKITRISVTAAPLPFTRVWRGDRLHRYYRPPACSVESAPEKD